jgi:hypothetical protein
MSYRHADEQPPDAFRPVGEHAGERVGHILEVDPALMTEHVRQQAMPVWDTRRIVDSRSEHLAWMHRHWAWKTLSGEELLAELDQDRSTSTRSPAHDPSREFITGTTEKRELT